MGGTMNDQVQGTPFSIPDHLLFSQLVQEGRIISWTDPDRQKSVVEGEEFIYLPFNQEGGYDDKYLVIKTPFQERPEQNLFHGVTLEFALPSDFKSGEGWAELKVVLETSQDPWVELNLLDLKAIESKKWAETQFIFPSLVPSGAIQSIRLVPNSKERMDGGLYLKRIKFNETVLDLDGETKSPPMSDHGEAAGFIDLRKLNGFIEQNGLKKFLILSKDPDGFLQEWERTLGVAETAKLREKTTFVRLGPANHGTFPETVELSKISKAHDYRHILELYDYNKKLVESDGGTGTGKIPQIVHSSGKRPISRETAERVKLLEGNFDLALIQGSDDFERILVLLHQASCSLKVNGFLALWDSGLPATHTAVEFFKKNREQEFRLVSNKNHQERYAVWQRAMYYDPRKWDHFVDFQ